MQVNQNVNAANFLLVSSQASNSVPTKEELTNSLDFADVLQSTSNQQTNNYTLDVSSAKKNSRISSGEEFVNDEKEMSLQQDCVETKVAEKSSTTKESTDTTDSKVENTEVDSESKEIKEEFAEKEQAIENDVMQYTDGLEELSAEDMEIIFDTIGNLLYEVMQQFDLSLEELSAKLDEFGMEVSDLLTQDGLKDFFLQMNGVDVSDLIVDEELNQQFQLFMTQVSEQVETLETSIPDMEKFVSNEEVTKLFSELSTVQGQEQQGFIDVVTIPMDEVIISEEPDVIVDVEQATDVNLVKEQNMSDSKQQQTEESLQQNTSRETTTTEQTSVKTPTFENPILQAIQNAMNQVESVMVEEQQVQQTDVLRQVVEQVRVNMNQQQTSLELQLYPEHLGRIQINVVSKEGVMTASIVAETEAAKQAIEAGLMNLKETMEQQNLKVDAIEVMVSTMGFERGDEQQQSFDEKGSSNPRRKIDLSELGEEVTVEEDAEIEKMKAAGSSVSYRA